VTLSDSPDADSIALLIADLDGFKILNDKYGHAAGDGVLLRVSQLLSGAARKPARAYRIGGDEFAILLPQSGEQDATRIAERVSRAIAERPRRAHEAPIPPFKTSIGVAVARACWSPTELIEAANAALNAAKVAGGGVVRVYNES
jgi:diguanylate cyclase (GGDEF)-like protein